VTDSGGAVSERLIAGDDGSVAGEEIAREMKAAYRAGGVRAEVEATLPLSSGERVLTEGMVRRYANTFVQRPCYIRLTSTRLVMLEHFPTRPDQV